MRFYLEIQDNNVVIIEKARFADNFDTPVEYIPIEEFERLIEEYNKLKASK